MAGKKDIVEQALKLIFSGSKAVDETGAPVKLYHGTTKDVSVFKPGSYFTEDPSEGSAYTFWNDLKNADRLTGKYSIISAPETAGKRLEYFGTISDIDDPKAGEFYATDNGIVQYAGGGKWKVANDVDVDEHSLDVGHYTIGVKSKDTSANAQKMVDEYEEFLKRAYPGGYGGNVIPAYLNVKNPKEMSPLEGNRFGERLGADPKWVTEEIEKLKAQGYDSIVTTSDDPFYAMEGKKPPKQYIIFEPNQAKSAIGNTGEYDFTNPDITKSEGGSVREGYQTKGRVVGDVVDQALKLVMGAGPELTAGGIRAYHGSPHYVDRFDVSKIGTGEGAQAYGHGLYFAENEGVAKGYRDALKPGKGLGPEDTASRVLDIHGGDTGAAISSIRQSIERAFASNTPYEEIQRLMQAKNILNTQPHRASGRMYEVDIDADPNTFLDWDKPLSEQPENVRRFFSKRADELKSVAHRDVINDDTEGSVLYRSAHPQGDEPVDWRSSLGHQVSNRLREEGIPGIKYLDAGSRGVGEGTRNYVVFDEKLISIIRKYGIAGASAMVGYDLMENLDPKQALAATMADREYQEGRPHKSEGGANAKDPYAEEIAMAKALMSAKAYEDQPWSEWAGDVAQNAVNTAKSILPTALGGRGEVGISDIARGAYEAGKDAVTFPGDVISGKQALFDDRGRPLESAVGRSFNVASTLGGASSVVPRPSNSLGVFGGIKSLTADKPAIRKAMAMESKGANRDDIWTETGWGRGADSFWRYEIPDIGSTVDSSALEFDLTTPSTRRAKLGDYLQHPEFFAAYPQFKNMEVSTFPTNSNYQGMYYPIYDRGTINPSISEPYIVLNGDLLSSGAAQRSTLLHELQHAVQQKEGFAPGTNLSAQASGRTNPAVERYENAVKNNPEMKELMSIRSSMDYKKDIDAANEIYTVEYRPVEYEIDRMNISKEEKNAKYDALMAEYDKRVNGMFPNLGRVKELENNIRAKNIPLYYPNRKILTPMESYLQYSGETEARNVQDRRDWEKEKLRAIPPWNTHDYPFEDQLLPENDVTWKFGYADGGDVSSDADRDIESAMMIAGGM